MGYSGLTPRSFLGKSSKDASKLPPLVFTQRDLNRFRAPKSVLSWPVSNFRLGAGFGWRRDPFTKKLRFHYGLDISSRYGAIIRSAAAGYIWRTGWLGSCGLGVVIRHPGKTMTYYCHLSQILAQQRHWIKRGEIIGKMGSTGRSTGPHLHFSFSINGKSVNPRKYLP